jgi:hypothetical protein
MSLIQAKLLIGLRVLGCQMPLPCLSCKLYYHPSTTGKLLQALTVMASFGTVASKLEKKYTMLLRTRLSSEVSDC